MKKILCLILSVLLMSTAVFAVSAETEDVLLIAPAPEAGIKTMTVLDGLSVARDEAQSITFSKGERTYTTEEPSILDLFFEFAEKIELYEAENVEEPAEGGYHVMIETKEQAISSVYVSPLGDVNFFKAETAEGEAIKMYKAAEPEAFLEMLKIFMPGDEIIVAVSDWAAPALERAYKENFIPETLYIIDYTLPIRREAFCELAMALLTKCGISADEDVAASPFADTENSVVASLHSLGIINGKSETEFAPKDFLTREEAAAILHRMSGLVGLVSEAADLAPYADDEDIADWAKESVYAMGKLGIMLEASDTEFAPKAAYTAEQAVVTVLRLFDAIQAKTAE